MSVHRPDLEAEQELDLGAFWSALLTRWWLPVAGLVVGAILGYVVSFGGSATYSAQAVVYLGQPLSPGGGAQLQSLASNPTAVRQIVTSQAIVREVAARSGLTPAQLRGHTSTNAVTGAIVKAGQTPLVTITVKGGAPRKVAVAANAFARLVVANVSGYVAGKIASLRARIEQDRKEEAALKARLTVINRALAGQRLSTTDQLIVSGQATSAEQQLGTTQQDELQARQLLSLAQNVEASRVVTAAAATKSSARSRRNYLAVGLFIGLIVGILAALLWEPVARSARRPTA